jgi:cellulose synthase/poly-beta-1,6-N-acetylglucosamine synthase-like glycosyltransferase
LAGDRIEGDAAAGPLVSVIVPAFNAEAFLAESLESAATQTHRALEIIIVRRGLGAGLAVRAGAPRPAPHREPGVSRSSRRVGGGDAGGQA